MANDYVLPSKYCSEEVQDENVFNTVSDSVFSCIKLLRKGRLVME